MKRIATRSARRALAGASMLVAPLRLAESLPLYGMWLFEPRGYQSRLGPEVFAPAG